DLVKELNSSDVTSQQRAVEKADCYIAALKEKEEPCKTLLNRTVINTNPSQRAPAPTGSQNYPSSSADNFMKIMENDAEDRHKRRQMKQEKANALKEKGNVAYAQGEYETAVKLYSDGLDERRDMQPLYTNRAQSYIKLEKYKEAISDCEWALKCNEKCVKAYYHMGKAHLALKNYNESRMCYQKILEIEPGREKMVKDYLTQVDFEEERECQESKAWEEFDKEEEKATTVLQLLKKLDRPNQFPLYYCGGLKLLSHAITDCTGQTLFRLNNGFSIIQTNDTLPVAEIDSARRRGAMYVRTEIVEDENQKMLMRCPASKEYIVDLLASGMAAVRKECLAFLSLYSQTPHGRRLAIENLNLHMLVGNLMACVSTQSQLETTALTILDNFATENKYLRDTFKTLIVLPFASLLEHAVPISGVCLGLLSDPDGGIITVSDMNLTALHQRAPTQFY
ncbi:unnamed protein product, partial [Coregonus sp. 'balchen']